MSPSPVSVLLDGRSFLEAPRWHEGRLWVSDQYLGEVLAVDPETGDAEVMARLDGGHPAGLGWLPDGRLLVVSMIDRHLLRQEPGGELVVHADLSGYCGGSLNELVVDAQGRAYAGNFGFDLMSGEASKPTVLVRIDPDGTTSVAAKDLTFPNGTVIIPRGEAGSALAAGGPSDVVATLVLAETFDSRLTAFDVTGDGTLLRPRLWADLSGGAGRVAALPADDRPAATDGICVDAEGAVWVADAYHNRVLRVREGGEVVDEVSTGDEGTYACALGGADGRTLFICTARSFLDSERAATREARVLTSRVDVPAA
ncbi:SMP-30/gluconolactonase/LRE family protein [Pseudofrankia inefficax]|uniref:SMP-30/Gluconolaconase/LRE-like region-containing protein n=1 Tax=Pseudofrankia inefficax (strain DSM 45817 / CECT 9037 / DDB 130130 / EuI1c) TaxID=298654 RepID=E3IVU8_PSEI1|nr:SMP-30/gluconolactonase/LRE family protein [Pseudofrankia inefficax]ADP83750.1 SMP-30/Gluconolaconase/LRE-like region-containing protein [Pseudofrankia inefficax]